MPDGVTLRLLGDAKHRACGDRLRAAVSPWIAQYGGSRPIDVRRAPERTLHDRLIIVDKGREAWSVSQSLKDLAARSPASIIKVPTEILSDKVAAFEQVWSVSSPL